MNIVNVKSVSDVVIRIPEELFKKCGFIPFEEVVVQEEEGKLILQRVERKPEFKTIGLREAFMDKPGLLSHLGIGSNIVGDFDEKDID